MNRTRSLIKALTMGLALAFLATAADAATTTGVVVSTDIATNVVTIETEDGRQFSFLKDDATIFEAPFADLEPGDRITVTTAQAPSDPTERLLATRVQTGDRMVVAANDRLPATATPLPLVTLAALASIMTGIGLRLRRR